MVVEKVRKGRHICIRIITYFDDEIVVNGVYLICGIPDFYSMCQSDQVICYSQFAKSAEFDSLARVSIVRLVNAWILQFVRCICRSDCGTLGTEKYT